VARLVARREALLNRTVCDDGEHPRAYFLAIVLRSRERERERDRGAITD